MNTQKHLGCVQEYTVIANVLPWAPVPNEERRIEQESSANLTNDLHFWRGLGLRSVNWNVRGNYCKLPRTIFKLSLGTTKIAAYN